MTMLEEDEKWILPDMMVDDRFLYYFKSGHIIQNKL